MNKKEELGARLNDTLKKAEGWGQFSNDSNDLKGRSFNGHDYKAKIQDAHKEANAILKQINLLNKK